MAPYILNFRRRYIFCKPLQYDYLCDMRHKIKKIPAAAVTGYCYQRLWRCSKKKKTKKCQNFSFSYGLGMTWGWIIPLINCCQSMSRINLKSLNWRAVAHIFLQYFCLCFIFRALKAPVCTLCLQEKWSMKISVSQK